MKSKKEGCFLEVDGNVVTESHFFQKCCTLHGTSMGMFSEMAVQSGTFTAGAVRLAAPFQNTSSALHTYWRVFCAPLLYRFFPMSS